MLSSPVLHLQGVRFVPVSLQKAASWKASSSFMCSYLSRVRPAKTLQHEPVALVGMGVLSAGAEVLSAGISDLVCAAIVHHLYSCRGAGFSRLAIVAGEWEEKCQHKQWGSL